MTTYEAIRALIIGEAYSTPESAWTAIMNAYNKNKIDGYELESLARLVTDWAVKQVKEARA